MKLIKKNETGRSMIEMLSSLAIMGILSVGALYGYSYAMDKHRANETMDDINLRVTALMTQAATTDKFNLDELSTTSSMGYKFTEAFGYDTDTSSVFIGITGLPDRVCEMVYQGLTSVTTKIILNDKVQTSETADCNESDNTLILYFDTPIQVEQPEEIPEDPCENKQCPTNFECQNGDCVCPIDANNCPDSDFNPLACMCCSADKPAFDEQLGRCVSNIDFCTQKIKEAGLEIVLESVNGQEATFKGELKQDLYLPNCTLRSQTITVTNNATLTVAGFAGNLDLANGSAVIDEVVYPEETEFRVCYTVSEIISHGSLKVKKGGARRVHVYDGASGCRADIDIAGDVFEAILLQPLENSSTSQMTAKFNGNITALDVCTSNDVSAESSSCNATVSVNGNTEQVIACTDFQNCSANISINGDITGDYQSFCSGVDNCTIELTAKKMMAKSLRTCHTDNSSTDCQVKINTTSINAGEIGDNCHYDNNVCNSTITASGSINAGEIRLCSTNNLNCSATLKGSNINETYKGFED